MNTKLEKASRYLIFLLRHDPEKEGWHMDKEGWVSVNSVLNSLKLTTRELNEIVETNNKKRFELSNDGKIRAAQGHSKHLQVTITYPIVESTGLVLLHGTAAENQDSIQTRGLHAGVRDYVHLSDRLDTAQDVGFRRSKQICIFEVDCTGLTIFRSSNGVYLTRDVPPENIKLKCYCTKN